MKNENSKQISIGNEVKSKNKSKNLGFIMCNIPAIISNQNIVKPEQFGQVALVECHQCKMNKDLSVMINCNRNCQKSYCLECAKTYDITTFEACFYCMKICKCQPCKEGRNSPEIEIMNPNSKVVKIDDVSIIECSNQESEEVDNDDFARTNVNEIDHSNISLQQQNISPATARTINLLSEKRKKDNNVDVISKPVVHSVKIPQNQLANSKSRSKPHKKGNKRNEKMNCVSCNKLKKVRNFKHISSLIEYLYRTYIDDENKPFRADVNDNFSTNCAVLKSFYNTNYNKNCNPRSQSVNLCYECLKDKMTKLKGFSDLIKFFVNSSSIKTSDNTAGTAQNNMAPVENNQMQIENPCNLECDSNTNFAHTRSKSAPSKTDLNNPSSNQFNNLINLSITNENLRLLLTSGIPNIHSILSNVNFRRIIYPNFQNNQNEDVMPHIQQSNQTQSNSDLRRIFPTQGSLTASNNNLNRSFNDQTNLDPNSVSRSELNNNQPKFSRLDPNIIYNRDIELPRISQTVNVVHSCNSQSLENTPQTSVPYTKRAYVLDNNTMSDLSKLDKKLNISKSKQQNESYNTNKPILESKLQAPSGIKDSNPIQQGQVPPKEQIPVSRASNTNKDAHLKDKIPLENNFNAASNLSNSQVAYPHKNAAERIMNEQKELFQNQNDLEYINLLYLVEGLKHFNGRSVAAQAASIPDSNLNAFNPKMLKPILMQITENLKKKFFSLQFTSIIQKIYISYVLQNFEKFLDELGNYHSVADTAIQSLLGLIDPNDKKLVEAVKNLFLIMDAGFELFSVFIKNFSNIKTNGIKTFENIDVGLKENIKGLIKSFEEAFASNISEENNNIQNNINDNSSLIEGMRAMRDPGISYNNIIPIEVNNPNTSHNPGQAILGSLEWGQNENLESNLINQAQHTEPVFSPDVLNKGLKKSIENQGNPNRKVSANEQIYNIKENISSMTSSKSRSLQKTSKDGVKCEKVIKTDLKESIHSHSNLKNEAEHIKIGNLPQVNAENTSMRESRNFKLTSKNENAKANLASQSNSSMQKK